VLRHGWCKNGKTSSISGNYRKYLRIDAEARSAYWKEENRPDYKIAWYGLIVLCVFSLPAVWLKYTRRRR
jgi:hypothetical protein